MSFVEHMLETYQFNRGRTLALLEKVEGLPDPQAALAFRPGPGRAHIGWQFMHVGVTEEIFATERLAPEKPRAYEELWPRFRGGSTPDDDVPSPALLRQVLAESREHLLETLAGYGDDRLEEIPPPLAERGLNMRQVLMIIGWHEAHHHGQAHAVLNVFLGQQG